MQRSKKAKKPPKSNIGIQDPTYTRLIKAGKHNEANRYVDTLIADIKAGKHSEPNRYVDKLVVKENLKPYYGKPYYAQYTTYAKLAERKKNSKSSSRKKSKSKKTPKKTSKKTFKKTGKQEAKKKPPKQVVTRAPMKSKKIKKSEASELKRHMFIFKTLTKSNKRTDIILKNAPLKLYKSLRLLFKLLVKGAFPLKPTHRSKLKKWAPFIRKNSKGKHSDIKRRVSQNGEGLGDILKTVLPMITPILSLMI